jgi:hypothetical protein
MLAFHKKNELLSKEPVSINALMILITLLSKRATQDVSQIANLRIFLNTIAIVLATIDNLQ